MHILIIPSWYVNTYNLLYGIFFKEQAEALAKYDNNVGVIAIQEIDIRQIVKKNKFVFGKKLFIENNVVTFSMLYPQIPKIHKFRRKIKLLIFKQLFELYIKENGMPDIVHLHSFGNGELVMWIKDRYNIPYVVTEHLSGFSRGTVVSSEVDRAKKVFKESEYNIAVSNKFAQLLKGKVNEEFNYIPNIVNIDFFDLETNVKRENFEFINIAFLDKNKNQAMLVKAFYNAFKSQPKIRMTIVGDGPEYYNLTQLIRELNLEERVLLYGRATREEVKMLLQNSDVFVLSSLYETFGVVVIEAMACGLPVIATKCGGPESIIINENIGLLSDIDENSLSKKLIQIMENRSHYSSSYIRGFVKDDFSEEAVVLKLKDVYELVLK